MKTTRLFLTAALAVLVVAGIIAELVVTAPRRHLDSHLRQLASVEIGKTRLEDFRKQIESNSGFSCNPQACSFLVLNETLVRLHLAPRTAVQGEVDFKDGIASEIYIRAEIRNQDGELHPDSAATVHQAIIAGSCKPHYSSRIGAHRVPDAVIVTMDSCVSSTDRAKAFAVSGACLTRIGGCRKAEEILPEVGLSSVEQ